MLPAPDAPTPYAAYMYRVLRGVAQETGKLNLVLAGVNAMPSESAFLAGEDNPLFGLLSVDYLGPLAIADCEAMVRSVGRKMQVRWESAPALALSNAVGGHPLLARLAASNVITAYADRPLRPNVQQVNAALRAFARDHSAIFDQMLQSLRRYYPDEFEFLQIVASGDIAFASEFADANPTVLSHLVGYGILDETLQLTIPVFADWLRTTR
jgi:hypothetical protein